MGLRRQRKANGPQAWETGLLEPLVRIAYVIAINTSEVTAGSFLRTGKGQSSEEMAKEVEV